MFTFKFTSMLICIFICTQVPQKKKGDFRFCYFLFYFPCSVRFWKNQFIFKNLQQLSTPMFLFYFRQITVLLQQWLKPTTDCKVKFIQVVAASQSICTQQKLIQKTSGVELDIKSEKTMIVYLGYEANNKLATTIYWTLCIPCKLF